MMRNLLVAISLAFATVVLSAAPGAAHVEPNTLTVPIYEFGANSDVWVIEGTKLEIRLDEMQHVKWHWEIDHIDGTGVRIADESHPNTPVLYADMAGSYVLKLDTVYDRTDPYQRSGVNYVVLKYLDEAGKVQKTMKFRISVRAR